MTLIYLVRSLAVSDYACVVRRSPDDADLCVYETKDQTTARGTSGVWSYVNSKPAAEISLWVSYAASLADFSICYVASPDLAGWRRSHPLAQTL